jgi:hypothetical protein
MNLKNSFIFNFIKITKIFDFLDFYNLL